MITLGPTSVPPLVITKGGVYAAPAGAAVEIADTDGALITIQNSPLICTIAQTTTKPIWLTVENNWITAQAGQQAITVWRFTHLYINQNGLDTGGILLGDFGSAVDFSIRANTLTNIDGGGKGKMAGISVQNSHVPHTIGWNEIVNETGCMEDGISHMLAGGKSADAAGIGNVHDNYISGCATASPTGSGFLVFDPGSVQPGDPRTQVPCYVTYQHNIARRIRNQAFVAAGGSYWQILNNLAVNDGSVVPSVYRGYQAFDWASKTGAKFGEGCVVSGNRSCCYSAGQRVDFDWQKPVVGVNDQAVNMTDADALAEWTSKLAANRIKPGPTIARAA